jgi:hypothetical protein
MEEQPPEVSDPLEQISDAIPLSYRRAQGSSRRAIRNAVVLLGFILSCSFLYEAGPRIWESFTRYYWMRRARTFTLASGTVVFQEQPGPTIRDMVVAAHPEPEPWSHLHEGHPIATLFLHERIAKTGEPVLVEIDTDSPTANPTGARSRLLFLNVRFIDADGSQAVFPYVWLRQFSDLQNGDSIQFLWGEADPTDLSHCTIKFNSKQRSGVIDVWIDSPTSAHAAAR